MIFLAVLAFILKIVILKASNDLNLIENSLSSVIVTVAREVYVKKCSAVRIVYQDNENVLNHLELVTENFLQEPFPVTFETSEEIQIGSKAGLHSCAFILIESLDSFLSVFSKITSNTFNLNGFYTIAFTDNDFNQTDETFELLWKKRIVNVVVLTLSKNLTRISTYYPFNKLRCGDTTAMKIGPREVSKFFRNKLSDLKNCPVAVGAPAIIPFLMMNSKKEVIGRDIEVLKALSHALGFKLDLWFSPHASYYGNLYENGTSTGSFNDLLEGRTDILIGDFFLKFIRMKHLDATATYYNSEIVFTVPPGRELKSFEKLLQPFSQCVWIVLAVFALLISFVILVTKQNWNDMIFGNRSPNLILFSIALGVSIPSFPSTSFARILLMSYILFCLVVQAVYAGLLFTYLQSDSRLKEVSSISEMLENDFKFYTIGLVNDIMKHHQAMLKRYLVVSRYLSNFYVFVE